MKTRASILVAALAAVAIAVGAFAFAQRGDHADHAPTGHPSAELGADGAPFDGAFIDNMVPHHEGAIEMARAAAKDAKREPIRALANRISSDQAGEIAEMKGWRESWYGSPDTPAEMRMEMPGMDPHVVSEADDVDRAFIDTMIVHHESAVDMAKQAESKAEHAEVRQLAERIVSAQEAEVEQMKAWRSEWYGSSTSS